MGPFKFGMITILLVVQPEIPAVTVYEPAESPLAIEEFPPLGLHVNVEPAVAVTVAEPFEFPQLAAIVCVAVIVGEPVFVKLITVVVVHPPCPIVTVYVPAGNPDAVLVVLTAGDVQV